MSTTNNKYMLINNLIRKIIKEETEEWVEVTPEDYIDLLTNVSGNGSFIKRLPDYRGKKIKITGNLKLNGRKDIENIDSIDYVDGNLDISYSSIPYFDKEKVKGSFNYYNSKMYMIKEQKDLQEKLQHQQQLREEDAWNVDNDDDESNETEAIYDYLLEKRIPQLVGVDDTDEETGEETYEDVREDKYFLFKERYSHYGGNMYTWLGSDNFKSEYVVYSDDEIHQAAVKSLEDTIEELGFDAFRPWVWEMFINEDYTKRWLYDYFEEDVRRNPEDFNINKELSDEQKRFVKFYNEKINKLRNRIETEDLTEEQISEIEDEIGDVESVIEDIQDSPEGDYSEEEIDDTIEGMVDERMRDLFNELRDMGFDNNQLLDFVDVDKAIDYVIRDDGYGEVLNRYDGHDDEYKVNGTWYHVMRHN